MRAFASAVAWLILFASIPCAMAGPGEPDASFGVNGVQLLDFGMLGNVTVVASARQSDGRIIAVGHSLAPNNRRRAVIGRMNTDGTLDSTFGTAGWTVLDRAESGYDIEPRAVAIRPDDRIVIVGVFDYYSQPSTFVARLLASGGIDPDIPSSTGMVVDNNSFAENPRAVAILPTGNLVVAGGYTMGQSPDAYFVIYDAYGLRNYWIGDQGRFRYPMGAGDDEARAVVVAQDGGFYLVGYADDASGNRDFAVARVQPDFALNAGFGNGGVKTVDFGGQDDAFALAVRDLGHLYVAGRSASGGTAQFAFASMSASSGNLDLNFGVDGKTLTPIPWQSGPGFATVTALQVTPYTVMPFGFIAFGTVRPDAPSNFPDPNSDMVIARYDIGGHLVSYFGALGVATTPGGPEDGDRAVGGYIVDGDRLLTIGGRFFAGSESLIAARNELGNGATDWSFGTNGNAQAWAYIPSRDYLRAAALLGDGRFAGVVRTVDGRHQLFRVLSNGAWDAAFGASGAISLDQAFTYRVAGQADGKIVTLNEAHLYPWDEYSPNVLPVRRYADDGSADYSFNGSGSATIDFQTHVQVPAAIVVQPDGKILVAATVVLGYGSTAARNRIGVARLNADGSPDYGFGYKIVIDPPGASGQLALGMAVQPDGGIVVSGTTDGGIVVHRITPYGAIDWSWANNGGNGAFAPCAFFETAGIAAGPDGSVVVSGNSNDYPVSACFARFLPSGLPDMAFGSQGVALHALGSSYDSASGVAIQPDGKVLASILSSGRAAIARLATDGSLDLSYNNGVGFADIPTSFRGADGVILQPDGNAVVWGTGAIYGNEDAMLARFQGGGTGTDQTPDQFTFIDQGNVSPGNTVISNTVAITGIDIPAVVSVSGGEYSINCSMMSFTATPGPISPGQSVCVRHISAMNQGQATHTTLTVGGVSDTFTSVTLDSLVDTLITAMPPSTSTSPTASFSFASSPQGLPFECMLDASQWTPCTSPIEYTGLTSGTYFFQVRALGQSGPDTSPAAYRWEVNLGPPLDTTMTNMQIGSTDAFFEFVANDPSAAFECRLDGAPFAGCTSPASYSGLAEGEHTFAVRARNGNNFDTTPASITWAVDTTPPDTILLGGPSGTVPSTSATFTFAASEEGATLVCALDSAQLVGPCVSPLTYTNLAQGPHRFVVVAFDGNGNVDQSPIVVIWAVDTVAPETSIDSAPSASISSTSATIAFSANEPATFECSLDGAAFASCASPVNFTGLSEGTHTFRVRATDLVGFVDATPAVASWTIDASPPDTTITSGPSVWTSAQTSVFTFTSNDPGATFECQLDGLAFVACTTQATYSGLAEGGHVFRVRAVDAAGNFDPTPAEHQWTIDLTSPDTLITSGPAEYTASTSATITFQSNEANVAFQCRLDGAVFAACTSPISYSALAQGVHTFEARAIDAAGNADASPSLIAWTIDTAQPDTTITSGPASIVAQTTASLAFTSNEPATFQCSLDGAAFAPCASPVNYSGLAEGLHSFLVRAVDGAGNVDSQPASWTWTVDTTPPDTSLFFQPLTSPTNSTSFTASTTTPIGPMTYECRLDGAAFTACTMPHSRSGLADGTHTFELRAIDGAGNVDPTPASHTWVIDTTPPDTTIASGPSGITVSTSATFSYTSSESPSTFFDCRLDAGAWSGCGPSSFYSGLADGSHTFEVRARDQAGNVDPTPASRTWTIDSVAPDTSITSGPSGTVASTAATLAFASNEGGASFECRLDGAAFAVCASPVSLSGLGQGGHTFEVRARDAAGNLDASPASRAWGVDTAPPETTIASGPSGSVSSTSAAFTFSASESPATFQCRLDGAVFAACGGSYAGLAQGSHTFEVRATDAVGNTDPTPASRTWTVDTVAPDTTITGGPSGNNNPNTATFTFASSEGGSTFQCALDGAAFTACASGVTYNGLAKGDHTFQVRALDLAANLDPTPATRTWRSK